MIRVVASIVVAEENVEEFLTVAKELVEKTNEADGPISYNLVRSMDDPTQFLMLEAWDELATLEAHLATEHSTATIPRIGALAIDAPPANVFEDVF